jgi:hypothetical protein
VTYLPYPTINSYLPSPPPPKEFDTFIWLYQHYGRIRGDLQVFCRKKLGVSTGTECVGHQQMARHEAPCHKHKPRRIIVLSRVLGAYLLHKM